MFEFSYFLVSEAELADSSIHYNSELVTLSNILTEEEVD